MRFITKKIESLPPPSWINMKPFHRAKSQTNDEPSKYLNSHTPLSCSDSFKEWYSLVFQEIQDMKKYLELKVQILTSQLFKEQLEQSLQSTTTANPTASSSSSLEDTTVPVYFQLKAYNSVYSTFMEGIFEYFNSIQLTSTNNQDNHEK